MAAAAAAAPIPYCPRCKTDGHTHYQCSIVNVCLKCGTSGLHKYTDCPSPDPESAKKNKICIACAGSGHWEGECPVIKEYEARTGKCIRCGDRHTLKACPLPAYARKTSFFKNVNQCPSGHACGNMATYEATSARVIVLEDALHSLVEHQPTRATILDLEPRILSACFSAHISADARKKTSHGAGKKFQAK